MTVTSATAAEVGTLNIFPCDWIFYNIRRGCTGHVTMDLTHRYPCVFRLVPVSPQCWNNHAYREPLAYGLNYSFRKKKSRKWKSPLSESLDISKAFWDILPTVPPLTRTSGCDEGSLTQTEANAKCLIKRNHVVLWLDGRWHLLVLLCHWPRSSTATGLLGTCVSSWLIGFVLSSIGHSSCSYWWVGASDYDINFFTYIVNTFLFVLALAFMLYLSCFDIQTCFS